MVDVLCVCVCVCVFMHIYKCDNTFSESVGPGENDDGVDGDCA